MEFYRVKKWDSPLMVTRVYSRPPIAITYAVRYDNHLQHRQYNRRSVNNHFNCKLCDCRVMESSKNFHMSTVCCNCGLKYEFSLGEVCVIQVLAGVKRESYKVLPKYVFPGSETSLSIGDVSKLYKLCKNVCARRVCKMIRRLAWTCRVVKGLVGDQIDLYLLCMSFLITPCYMNTLEPVYL
jgi:hypothetical protein